MSIDISVSKLNVINREYKSIYQDLVKTVPLLTEHWNINDESDPGVVLVKLMSMLGDMLSYNTDKAYLEAFPDTVTQRKNAYQIFRLLGYKMRWYKSATCDCSFTAANNVANIIHIPRYTRIMSKDSTVCFTNPLESLYIAPGIDGNKDPRQQTTLVQGIPIVPDILVDSTYTTTLNSYVVNNNEKWHAAYKYNIDKEVINDNRIYFNKTNVEQTYITLVDDQDEEWEFVDNIDLYDGVSNKIFEFNVDEFDKPYIRLVDHWEDLDIARFKLFYIQSSGTEGRTNSGVLNSCGSDMYSLLNPSNPKVIVNNSDSTEGYDPETPDEARKTFSNYINTFDTLVTLDDFTKFVKRNEYAANAIALDITNDFNKYNSVSYSDEYDLASKFLSIMKSIFDGFDPSSLVRLYDIDSNGDITELPGTSSIISGETGDSYRLLTEINNRIETTVSSDFGTISTFAIYLYNLLFDCYYISSATSESSMSDIVTYKNEIDYIKLYYNKLCTLDKQYRSLADDITFIMQDINTESEIISRDVNIYISPDYNFTSYDGDLYEEEYKYQIESAIDRVKIMPLNIYTTTKGINYYNWDLSGLVYLKNPVLNSKAQDILVNINDKIKYSYSHDNIEYNSVVKAIDLINTIISTDSNIYYVDLENIKYTRYDKLSQFPIGSTTIDKSEITGEYLLQELPYKLSSSEPGYNTFLTVSNDSIKFDIDLMNDTYIDKHGNSHEYFNYTEQELQQGNVLLRPGSFAIILDNGTYIIKDTGYGSLVCNENIIKSSRVNYVRDNNGELHIEFELFPEISIFDMGDVNIRYSKNKLNMISFVGLNPGEFNIDSDSIEV